MVGTYVSILQRWAVAITALTLLLAPLGYLALSSGRDTWTSVSVLQVGAPTVAEGVIGAERQYEQPQQRLASELEVLGSDVVAQRAAQRLTADGRPTTVAALRRQVAAEARGVSVLIEVRGTGGDATEAVALAQALVDAYVSYRIDDQRTELEGVQRDLQARLAAAERELAALDAAPQTDPAAARQRAAALTRYETVNDLLGNIHIRLSVESGEVRVLTPPTVPTAPDRPLGALGAALGAVLGAGLLSVAIAVFVDLLRDPVRTRGDAEELTFVPVLADLGPRRSAPVDVRAALAEATSPAAAAARALRLRLAGEHGFPRLVVVTGTSRDLAEAAVAAALLAAACGRAGMRTLLVADAAATQALAARPRAAGGAPEARGAVRQWETDVPGVVVAALSSAAAEAGLMDVRAPLSALESLLDEHEVIVIVEPPTAVASIAVPRSEAVLLVCQLGRTVGSALVQRVADVERAGVDVDGLVLVPRVRSGPAETAPAEQAPVAPEARRGRFRLRRAGRPVAASVVPGSGRNPAKPPPAKPTRSSRRGKGGQGGKGGKAAPSAKAVAAGRAVGSRRR